MTCRKCQLFNTIISIITASLILIANCPTAFAAQDYGQSSSAILFKKMRCAYESTEDGERILHFYKKSAAEGEMFVAKSNFVLKQDTKYIVSFDYKCSYAAIRPMLLVMNIDTVEGWDENNENLGYYLGFTSGVEAYKSWRSESFIINTDGAVDGTYKYFSFAAKNPQNGADVDYQIKNLKIEEINDDFEFSSFYPHFAYADDGTRQLPYCAPSS